ncbi:dienelactone hydrolase family protein [Bacillus alkalicellulosilyticus]|uniref:dienelactone hydrolase family protein n=1 Tax=Alkalihalobacterium alkalicellulosilyticum TaxID=1912214 RepID=UPI000998C4F3|nr:dienelactone hydrolase family protein [Bacillus alkalicellulosilyticus]
MIKLTHSKNDFVIIVIHEIYGINQHMKYICEFLSDQRFDVICPNLYEHETSFDYSEEEIAYQHFMEGVGFENALHKINTLLSALRNEYKKVFVVGFSVGATIAWLCSEDESADAVVGYYGSRIRDYVSIIPKTPTMLFFPEQENSFNVDELISTLNKKNSKVYKFIGQHGFSDPYCSKYNEVSAQKALKLIIDFFQRIQYK